MPVEPWWNHPWSLISPKKNTFFSILWSMQRFQEKKYNLPTWRFQTKPTRNNHETKLSITFTFRPFKGLFPCSQCNKSMVKNRKNHRFSHEIWDFPVFFPNKTNQLTKYIPATLLEATLWREPGDRLTSCGWLKKNRLWFLPSGKLT